MSSMVPAQYGQIGSAGGFPLPQHPSAHFMGHHPTDVQYDRGVSGTMHNIIAGPVGPYYGELGGVTDDTSIRLFGGRLYTDSTHFVDVGADPLKAKQRMYRRGIPMLVLLPTDGRRTNIFSDVNVPPLGERQKESILIDEFYSDECMENFNPLNIRILADTSIFEEGETDNVLAHATSKTMETVVTHPYSEVKSALDKNVPGLYNQLNHLYRSSGHGHVTAMTFDQLYVFPVVTATNKILWIPVINPFPEDVQLITRWLSKSIKTEHAKRCLSRVYYVGKLIEPFIGGETGWFVSVECLQY